MATVEKRRSSRKSGHRKHNDGGYSDTETDREVSSLTDRAFRSLCIGDEAVYNDSDLSASPCAQKDTGRQELKRTAHESFSLRVQQYGQDWIYRGTYGAEIHKGQQWGVYGEKGAPEPPQQGYPPRELSLFSNGMTEVSSQQRRSHSRVSSLIRAFNSEGQGDEAVYNDETSWDKSSLMTIEGELSEFSSYPQNMNTGYFPSAGIFSSQNTDYYSSQVAAISQMNSASSFMRSSHSLSTQVNSNFFIHSEFSPFKVWRDQNRFPFHGGQVSGFMPRSEFQKWYETPMYKELSLQPQQHPSMFSQGYHRNTFAPAIPMNSQRSTSASTMMQRASAVEKRCESELAGQYRKRTQSMGANRLPPQRPSTASPSSEMSRRVRDTISSVKSLQQKIKMMAERNVETQSQDELYNNDYLNAYDPMVPNIMSSNPYTAPYQIQKSSAYAPPEPQQLLQQHSASPQPVEHAPVRAESRGATPDVKMSSYKSRAASLLYNLKDNRKRVKATYSPNAFKGQDTQEKYKQEAKDFIIDVPEFSANELLNSTDDRGNRLNVPQYGYQAHSPGMHMQNSQPVYENPTEMGKINVPQYGYQGYNSGMPQNSQPDFVNPVENSTNKLNVPQYGYQARSPGMPQNSQHMQNSHYHFVNPIEDRGNRLDVGQYGSLAHSLGMQQNIQFSQFTQNTQNSQQLYSGQNSSEYYRAQMQGEVAPHPGFTGYSHEYYANTQLTNGQNPYENISSFAPYKQSMSDKGGGNYVNQLEQNTEVQRFGAVVQSRDYVSKDNNTQQFNEAASGEYTGLDRYNQLKENKYDYNNVYSQDTWGQTNSQQIQKPGIPSAQNYQNINAYSRTNAQENVQNYNYEQKVMENYGARPHGTANVSNQMVQYAPPHLANTGNAGYNTQQQPGTYRDIYAPPSSHEFNKEIKMKENYAPRDNHKYYHQESKTQTIISSQAGMPIATEELGQRIDEAIKNNGMKGLQSKETRYIENSTEEKKTEQEQVKDISKRDQATNEQVFLQQNKLNVHKAEINEIKDRSKLNSQHIEHVEKEAFTKYRSAQDSDLPTAEEMIKQLREENSNSDHTKIQEVIDRQECMMESEPQRPEPEKQKPIVQHANTEGLKEEPIKCELAASNEEARIEQVKPEPSRKERVTTEQATETQAGAEHVERVIEEDRNEAKQAVMELIMESQANTKPEENKDIGIIDVRDKIPETEVQKSQEELEVKFTEEVKVTDNLICEEHAKMQQIPKEEATNVNNVESVSKSEPQQPAMHEPDKVEQTKTELAKTKAELAKIKEQMKGEQKVEKDEDEHTEQENDSAHTLSKEPPVTSVDLTDRGTDDFEHIREKYGYSQATARNKTFTTGNVSEQSTIPDKDDKLIEYRMDTNQDKKANSEVISDTRDDNEKTKNLYDDPTGSQYVYSESSKDFKLSIACNEPAHEETENISEFVSTKEAAPVEKEEKSNVPQLRDDAKQHLVNKCKMSQSNLPDNAAKEAILKNDACELNDPVPVEKVEKYDICQQKDAKQVPIERKTKPADHKTGSSKEISTKGVTHKEKAQTKQEILTSKIKAHAEKEISAIKEGFANKDGLKNPTKSLGIGQNVSIRQKPPSQEVYKKQEQSVDGDTSKVSAALTDTGQPADTPLKRMKNNENTKERVETVANNELHTSTKSFKMTENCTVQKDKKCGSPTDDKKIKPQHEDKSIKQDYLRKEDKVDLENTAPSLQLQNEISSQDNSLSIMGIMVTVRERNPSEENKDQDVKHGPHVETNITRLSDKVSINEQDYTETKHFEKMQETDSTTHKNFTDSTTEKTPQHESSFPKERPQSETLLPDHLAEKVVPPTVTVPAKNKVLAETQALPNKHDIMAQETKVCANKPPNAALETTGIKGQKEITGIRTITEELPTTEMKRVISVSTASNDNTQEDILHIDSIAIQVVPAVAEEVNKAPQRTASNSYFIEKETQSNIQKSVPSNDDVQKVLSSVKKQAQLLKNSNQPNLNNTSRESSENEKTTNEVETHKPPMEEGYFQVDKRDTVPQNNHTSMGQSSETVSQEQKQPRSLPNQPSSAIKQDQNIKTSIQTDNSPNDKSNKDEKPGVGHLHHTRRHPMAKGRQRGFATLPDSNDSKVEVKPKPKVPIPEISALADYARLKVIVSKDDEDTLQEQPPNKKEGFFPLIQSRHSRRPVFTMDSQEDPVKEKSSQNQSSTQFKVSKEPTPVVFPITDKQHQRTGMFKLEAKENADVQNIQQSKPTSMDQTPQSKTNNKEKNAEDKIKDMLEKSRAKQAEEEKRAAQREEEQRALEREAIVAQIRERRKKQREAERHMEEGKGKEQKGETEVVSNDEQQKEQLSERELSVETNPDGHDRMLEKKTASNTQRKMDAQNDLDQHKESHIEEQQRNAEEQKKKDSVDEHQKRAALEEQHKKVAQIEEQRRKAAKEEQLRKAALEEQTRRANEEQQRKAEEQKKAILEEKQRKAAQMEEEKRIMLLEEQQRRAAQKEQQRKMVEEEQQRQAAIIEEQKKKAAFEEQQRKLAQEELQRKAAQEEQKQKIALEEQQRRAAQKEQQRKMVEEEQQKQATIIEEQKKKAAIEEQHRKLAQEEQQRKAAQEEQKQKAALEEQQRTVAQKEQQRKMTEEEQRRQTAIIEEQKKKAAIEEQQRKLAQEEQQRKAALEEQKQKAALEEQQRRVAQKEHQRKMVEEEQRRQAAIIEEQKKKAAIEEQQKKLAQEKQQRKAALEEQKQQQQRVAQKEQQRKMAEEEQQRRAAIIEEQKKTALEEQRKLAHEEQQRKAQEEHLRKMAEEEQQRKAAIIEEQKKRATIEEQQRKMAQAAHEEKKRKAALEEQQRRAALEEQKQKAVLEEHQRRAAETEQLRKMAEEEQQKKAAIIEEQKKRAAIEEQQRKLAYEGQQKQAALEEQKKQKAALEEQKRRAAQKEQQRKMAEEEQQKKAAIIEEQKKRAAIEEQKRKVAQEEQQKQAALEEKKQKAALEEHQRRAAQKEQQMKMAEEEKQRKAAIIEEQTKRAAIEEHDRKAEEQQKKEALIEEQQRRAALKEEQRRAALEEQLRKNKMAEEEQRRKEALEEQRKIAQTEEMRRQAAHEEKLRKAAEIEERKRIAALQEEQQRKAKLEEQRRKAMMEEERKIAQIEEKRRQAAHEEKLKKAAEIEEQKRRAALEEQKRKAVIEEQRKLAKIKEIRRQAAHEEQLRKIAEEEQQKKAVIIEEERRAVLEEQQRSEAHKEQLKKAAKIEEQKKKAELEEQKQKAAIEERRRKDSLIEKQRQTRQEEEEKRLSYIREERIRRQIEEEREVELEEEMTRRQQSSVQNQTHTGKDTRRFRGQDLPRNQTEVRARPAVNQEETTEMEEQKNTSDKEALQYYSLTSAEAEKPSPPQKRSNANGPDTVDDTSRPYTPASPAPSQSRSTTASPAFGTKPSMFKVKDNTLRGSSVTKSIKPRFHKNFGEEFRVGSPMERVWEKNEGDLDTLRCRTPSTPLPQYRPFSRRSLALDEEDSRSIISNLSEDVESFATNATDLADIRALYDSDRPESACSFSSDVSRSFGRPPVVPPKSEKALRRAKRLATRRLKKELAKDVTEESYEASMSEVPNSDVVASPHFTPPISIARAPPAGSSVSLSHSEPSHQSSLHTAPHATGPISLPNSSSHTSTPVSSTQNPGSFSTPAASRSIPQVPSSPTHHHAPKPVTQYQVESGFSQSYTQRRVMQDIGSGQYYVVDVPVEVKTKTFFDPETGKYVQLNVRESNRNATQGQPLQGYPQSHLKPKLHAKLQPNTSGNAQYQGYSNNSKGYQSAATSSGQSMTPATVIQDQQPIRSSMAHRHGGPETSYSPDKTPYMDTVNKVDKAHHAVYNTQGSQGAITEGDSQLVNSRYGSRDIISMSELEDFMEVSDW